MGLVVWVASCGGDDVSLTDLDGDGFPNGPDCDDSNPDVHPTAIEVCDGIDNDCDDLIDDEDRTVVVDEPWYLDGDGDGYGTSSLPVLRCESPPNHVDNADDCNDRDADVHPDADELCDGVDNNCNGAIDSADATFNPDNGVQLYRDADDDGHGDASDAFMGCEGDANASTSALDCDDTDDEVHPDADEVCNDLVDNDCDGGPNDCWLSDRQLTTADRHFSGDGADQAFGFDVLIADLDADGMSEVLVGAWGDDGAVFGHGAVVVFAGADLAADSDAPAQAIWTGAAKSEQLGLSMANAGDIDGDGDNELLIGAPGAPRGEPHGQVYVIDGGSTRTSGSIGDIYATAWFGASGTSPRLGDSVAGYGDINGDGYADIGLGAQYDSGGGTNAGAIYLVYGAPSLPVGDQDVSHADAQLQGPASGRLGGLSSHQGVGDLDADGLDDWVVAAPTSDGEYGSAYLIYGDSSRLSGVMAVGSAAQATLLGGSFRGQFGSGVAGGDLTGDGYSDLIIGEQLGYTNLGAVWVYEGAAARLSAALSTGDSQITLHGEYSGDAFGSSITIVDLESDGTVDVVVGAPHYDAGGTTSSGAVYFFRGDLVAGTYGAKADSTTIAGHTRYQYLGFHSTAAGDVNGDGYPDLLFGGYGVFSAEGGADLFFGLGL